MVEIIKNAGSVAAPVEEAKKPRNPRSKKVSKAANALLEAVDFVSKASETTMKDTWIDFSRFVSGWAIASNGQMAAAHPIEEDLTICPHIKHLKAAVSRCGASIAITMLDSGRLSVSGGNGFRGIVPCIPGDRMPPVMPDRNIAPIDDRIKEGFAAVLKLAREDAETVVESSLLLRANTVVGTNRQLMLEYFHGNDLPPHMGIPQPFAKAITQIPLKLSGFGYTPDKSVTFYFENGAWIKTQLMDQPWPTTIDAMLNVASSFEPCPEKLAEGVKAVASFSKDGAVHFHDGKIKSSYGSIAGDGTSVYGASFDVPGLRGGDHYSARLLELALPAAVEIDHWTHADKMLLLNKPGFIRGILMKRS